MICQECGMVCEPTEFHPFEACLMFRVCHDGDQVRANLAFMRAYAEEAVRLEREACAAACESRAKAYRSTQAPGWHEVDHECTQCAAAIRARTAVPAKE